MIQFCELQNCPYTLEDLPIAAVELRPMRMEFNLTDEHGNIVELDPALVRAHRAVLFIDVVESVRLIEDDEAGFLSRWLPIVEQTRMQILPDVGGRLVKNLGDGLLLDFGDVRSAIAAAFRVRQIADSTNRGQPLQSHIQLRAGIELSDVVLDKDDIYGRGVNRAARLATLAGPGQIVTSATVRDQITADLDADIEDLGDCYLKHLARPIRAYRIGLPDPKPTFFPENLLPSLAVVPFLARGGGDVDIVLGEVIAEELIRDLSRSAELNLISRLSTTAFRNRNATASEIGNNLQVEYVLSGAYSIDGRNITIDSELAELEDGADRLDKKTKGSRERLAFRPARDHRPHRGRRQRRSDEA